MQRPENFDDAFVRHLCADQRADPVEPARNHFLLRPPSIHVDEFAAELSARGFEDQLRRAVRGEFRHIPVDAAFITVARVARDAELAARCADVRREENRALQQHISRRLGHAGELAAHHAGERHRLFGVGDHEVARFERQGLAVERGDRLPGLCAAGDDAPLPEL